MNKRILVLIDFTNHAHSLLTNAGHWAQKTGSELLIMHQTTPNLPSFADPATKQAIQSAAKAEAELRLQELSFAQLPAGLAWSVLVTTDPLAVAISRMLTQSFEQLVLLGLKEKGFLKQHVIGSMAHHLAEECHYPMVALPVHISAFTPQEVHIGVTTAHPLNEKDLRHFLAFTIPKDTTLCFFHISEKGGSTEKTQCLLEEYANRFGGEFRTETHIYSGMEPFEDMHKLVSDPSKAIVVLQRGSRLLSDHLFRPWLVHALLREAKTPLVVLS